MTNEEMEKTMQFILEQQARFTANFQSMEEDRERDSVRLKRLEDSFQLLVQLAIRADERMDNTDQRINNTDERIHKLEEAQMNSERKIAALADAQIRTNEQIAAIDEQIARVNGRVAETGERLNALIAVVERYISNRGQNGSSQDL